MPDGQIRPILPGSAIGVLGSGQLGRMFAIAARRMGYRVHTFSPDEDTPTGQVADVEVTADYNDLDAVRQFAKDVAVVTFEFENVPAATAAAAAEFAPVRPGGHVLHTAQHRLREKTFLQGAGFPVTRFRRISSRTDLEPALKEIGFPAILKTADFGYDGKGQFRITSTSSLDDAWEAVGQNEAVLEAVVPFTKEISVVGARTGTGAFTHFGAIENAHVNGILDVSIAPARISREVATAAERLTQAVMESLDVIGVLCVEYFLDEDQRLLINELAPRPHNSGHLTFDANLTSQFEQQLRTVCGLPLGSVNQLLPAAMVNLLGDLWSSGEPDWQAALRFPEVKLHLYGKLEARPGRKMGHLTALALDVESALQAALEAREALTAKP